MPLINQLETKESPTDTIKGLEELLKSPTPIMKSLNSAGRYELLGLGVTFLTIMFTMSIARNEYYRYILSLSTSVRGALLANNEFYRQRGAWDPTLPAHFRGFHKETTASNLKADKAKAEQEEVEKKKAEKENGEKPTQETKVNSPES
ncbi:uncharacterized protein N7483_001153 [Penicillium malachiteum]|uniref:uncharacterized protein n=1 Tax=Penicillium malachiteum TaxID=1324776 RepID=UPI0025465A62|nr:uncharacterized protein N7483_001153 [Penicillium malachiteum]KAJ5736028.1 hypothetical protein N7483_001153 [Penicillium malachiteum]